MGNSFAFNHGFNNFGFNRFRPVVGVLPAYGLGYSSLGYGASYSYPASYGASYSTGGSSGALTVDTAGNVYDTVTGQFIGRIVR